MASITSSAGTTLTVGQTTTITFSDGGTTTGITSSNYSTAYLKQNGTDVASGRVGVRYDNGGDVDEWNPFSCSYEFTPTATGTYVFNGVFDWMSESLTITVVGQETRTTTHKLTATASNYTSLQWKESSDGTTWTDITNGTGTELVIATGIGSGLGEETAVQASYSAIASYDKYVKCVATNATGTTESNIKHVTFTSSESAPTSTDVN